eukprot:GHVQ01007054.1.p1 GENE.GHVQ01007054.1~~GHVQ01007054.1.p1  ORF type:complete len:494 (-),score=103.88 GHVQ01007054.1:436-1917(-)
MKKLILFGLSLAASLLTVTGLSRRAAHQLTVPPSFLTPSSLWTYPPPPSSSFLLPNRHSTNTSLRTRLPSSSSTATTTHPHPPNQTNTPPSSNQKKTLKDLGPHDLSGKHVLLRSDLNVPMDDNATITDDTRIRLSMKTIEYLVGYGAKVLLSSHLGRPKGSDQRFSLRHIKDKLEQLLKKPVLFSEDCVGPVVEANVNRMECGDVLLLENVRFHKGETTNDAEFARQLAAHADLFVNDAFGAAHRAHASTEGVTKYLSPAVAGFLLDKELSYLSSTVSHPDRPFAAIVGGSKVSTKIGVMEALLDKVDKLFVGGGMIFTFYKARGLSVGSSLVEDDKVETARRLEILAKEKNVELILPTDIVIADKYAADAESRIVSASQIPDGWLGLDIGPQSTKMFIEKLEDCRTILWNGPMGVAEFDKFAVGTNDIAIALADLTRTKKATTIVGGGDSVAAVEKCDVSYFMTHISTGGGAALELLEGKTLPGVAALQDA